MQQRYDELSALFKRLYENNVLGRVSDEPFRMLSADYNGEQKAFPLRGTECQDRVPGHPQSRQPYAGGRARAAHNEADHRSRRS